MPCSTAQLKVSSTPHHITLGSAGTGSSSFSGLLPDCRLPTDATVFAEPAAVVPLLTTTLLLAGPPLLVTLLVTAPTTSVVIGSRPAPLDHHQVRLHSCRVSYDSVGLGMASREGQASQSTQHQYQPPHQSLLAHHDQGLLGEASVAAGGPDCGAIKTIKPGGLAEGWTTLQVLKCLGRPRLPSTVYAASKNWLCRNIGVRTFC